MSRSVTSGTPDFITDNEKRVILLKPFLKWPGGKRWLAKGLAEIIKPELEGVYYEPFLGAGALFLALHPEKAVLSDINDELMNCIRVSSQHFDKVRAIYCKWENRRECYEDVRKLKPRSAKVAAARIIYLSKTSWGGLYRTNARGEFNVPFGNSGRDIELGNNEALSCQAFAKADLVTSDFEVIIDHAKEGDVVYADPPYSMQANDNGFRRYHPIIFSWDDQKRLAKACKRASVRGAFIAVSGIYSNDVMELYKDWWALKYERTSLVSRLSVGRKALVEMVLFNRQPSTQRNKLKRI